MIALLTLPGWLTSEKDVTLATWGLVFVTAFLALITFWQGREERKRWQREDALRREETQPKADFGLKISEPSKELTFWCANLGTASFLISNIQIDDAVYAQGGAVLRKGPIIVPSGTIIEVGLGVETRNIGLRRNWNISVVLKGPTEELTMPSKAFSILSLNGQVADLQEEFRGSQSLQCPKCNSVVASLKLDGITTNQELREEMNRAGSDLEVSCPNHQSSSSRLTLHAD